ncbi:MAG: M28 family peptidase [Acidobacteria bacterium]|nr:M28 family peptidase [Acidobacteriota bacterium]
MSNLRRLCLTSFLASLVSLTLVAQSSPEWKVKTEWVRAHEAFLASDAIRGRGSATPDELIAATYVASQFAMYGLKPGLADGSYIQRVELVQPVEDGKAKILSPQHSDFSLQEDKDFRLQRTAGESVTAPLQKIEGSDTTAKIAPGAIVLVTGASEASPSTLIRAAFSSGAKAVLLANPSLKLPAAGGEQVSMRPRVSGTTAAMPRRSFTLAELTASAAQRLARLDNGTQISIEIKTKDTSRYSYNAVGVLPGTDSSPQGKVLLLSAHLDHLGIGRPVKGDDIYNGANDDASGTTAVMELAHALSAGTPLRRTIYFVCYGSEELGGLGSTYFREHPPVPLERIAANLEFEMIGSQDPKMPKGELMLTGYDRSNLGSTLAQHGALLGDDPYPEQHFFERSDNYPLALKGVVAHTAGGWGTPPTYHQPDDDLQHLDLDFMTQAIQSMIEPVRWLANSDFVPQWAPGRQPVAR